MKLKCKRKERDSTQEKERVKRLEGDVSRGRRGTLKPPHAKPVRAKLYICTTCTDNLVRPTEDAYPKLKYLLQEVCSDDGKVKQYFRSTLLGLGLR